MPWDSPWCPVSLGSPQHVPEARPALKGAVGAKGNVGAGVGAGRGRQGLSQGARGNLSLPLQRPATTSKTGPHKSGAIQSPPGGVEEGRGGQQVAGNGPKAVPLVSISKQRRHFPAAARSCLARAAAPGKDCLS